MNIRTSRGIMLRAASPIAFAALLPVAATAQSLDPALCDTIATSSTNAESLGATLGGIADPNAALLACAPTYDIDTLNAVIAAYEEAGDVNTVDQLRAVVADLTDTGSEELAATTQSVEEIVDPEGGERAAPAGAAAASTGDDGAKTITVDESGSATAETSVTAETGEPKTITVDENGEATATTGIDAVGADTTPADGDAAAMAEAPAGDAATDTTADAEAVVVTEAPADAVVTTDTAVDTTAETADPDTAALADALEQQAGDAATSGDAAVADQIAQEGAAEVDGAMAATDGTTTATTTAEAPAEVPAMDAETTAQVDAAGGDVAAGIEAPQVDTEASAEAANAVPVASAAAAAATEAPAEPTAAEGTTADATATAEGGGEVTTTTVTAENAPSATEDRRNRDDDDGFKNALLLGLGAVAVGTLLANQGQVVEDTGDRVVVRRDSGDLIVLKNDDVLLRQPGSTIQTRTYDDGSTLTTVNREDGSRVVTVRAANGQVLRRTVIGADGTETVLFDDTVAIDPVQVVDLDATASTSGRDYEVQTLQDALAADVEVDRRYSLQQIRQIRAVRYLAPELPLNDINFETNSSVIRPEEAEELRDLGVAMRDAILSNPGEVFLIEGHTDAVGSAAYNLALSDRRAESVALALTEFFDVPPENMVVQGYGESTLKVVTGGPERVNRRASVRRITPLLRGEV